MSDSGARQEFRDALKNAAGLWADRIDDGLAYQQRMRASLDLRRIAR